MCIRARVYNIYTHHTRDTKYVDPSPHTGHGLRELNTWHDHPKDSPAPVCARKQLHSHQGQSLPLHVTYSPRRCSPVFPHSRHAHTQPTTPRNTFNPRSQTNEHLPRTTLHPGNVFFLVCVSFSTEENPERKIRRIITSSAVQDETSGLEANQHPPDSLSQYILTLEESSYHDLPDKVSIPLLLMSPF